MSRSYSYTWSDKKKREKTIYIAPKLGIEEGGKKKVNEKGTRGEPI
jgi:hypothetical protein